MVGAAVTSLAVVVRLMGGEAFEKWAERVSEVVGALLARNHPCFEWDEEEEAGEEDEDDDMVHESRVMDAASDVLPAMAFVMREKFAPFLAAHYKAEGLLGSKNKNFILLHRARSRLLSTPN